MDIVEQSDNELLYMVRCGSKEAFDLLQYKYQKVIKKFITEYFNDFYIYGLDIEDIIQECLITFYESLFCFNEDKGMFYSYVMKSVKYRVYDLIKVSLSVKNNGFNYATTELEFENDNSYHNVERYGVDFEETKNLIDDSVIDSFAVIQIVTELMEHFDIFIDADDIEPENLNSLDAICDMVSKKLSQ